MNLLDALRQTIALSVLCFGLILAAAASAQDAREQESASSAKAKQWASAAEARRARSMRIAKLRPARRDTPLREENLRDVEVVEIESAVRTLYPGALVYLSAVTTGCPCEDGPKCEDQVWTVAERDGKSSGLLLSRIDNQWQVGPVQSWWLAYEEAQAAIRKSGAIIPRPGMTAAELEQRRKLWSRLEELHEAFPECATDVGQVIRTLEHIE